jgi:hypothetical protein
MNFEFSHREPLRFGRAGMAARWLNVIGRIVPCPAGTQAWVRIGQGGWQPLWLGPDSARLAGPGDFNVELAPSDLVPGANPLGFLARAPDGTAAEATFQVHWEHGNALMPDRRLDVDFRHASDVPVGVQVGDGTWRPTPDGWRTEHPAYDRCLHLGDRRWENYEVYAEMKLHGWRTPRPDTDAGANVIHLGIALRWPGHADDGNQPRLQWFPLGIAFEWRVDPAGNRLRLRALDPASFPAEDATDLPLERETTYAFRVRVASLEKGAANYAAKGWPLTAVEPDDWHLVHRKSPDPVRAGSVILVAHYTDVTMVRASVRPL